MEVTFEFKWNKKTADGLDKIPDDILFSLAKQTLDTSVSIEAIPIDTKEMRNKSVGYGVHRSHNDMTIGSPTSYAMYVWNLPQKTTHWTNKGKAHSQWYAYTLKKYGKVFIENAIEQAWKENM